jgi:hypothetical protein
MSLIEVIMKHCRIAKYLILWTSWRGTAIIIVGEIETMSCLQMF